MRLKPKTLKIFLKKIGLFLLFLLIQNELLWAQTPSYYNIGEKEFNGIDIYTMIQDNYGNMWLGTDNGIFKYDGKEIKEYICPEAKANSYFAMRRDDSGQIFCSNLRGQIFTIEKDVLKIHYTLPDSLINSYLDIAFSSNNDLLINTNQVYILKNDSLIITGLKSFPASFIIGKNDQVMFKTTDNLFYNYNTNGFFEEITLNPPPNKTHAYYKESMFIVNNSPYLSLTTRTELDYSYYRGDQWNTMSFKGPSYKVNKASYFKLKSNNILVADVEGKGGYFYDSTGELLFSQKILTNHIISNIYEDKENNLWISTLGSGVFIFPNLELLEFYNSKALQNEKIIHITKGPSDTIFAITKQRIFIIKKNAIHYFSKNHLQAQKIFYDPYRRRIIGQRLSYELNGKTKPLIQEVVNLKGAAFTKDHIVLGFNNGLRLYKPKGTALINTIDKTKESPRVWNLHVDNKNDAVWIESAISTTIFDIKTNTSQKVLNQNHTALISGSFTFDGEKMWCGSKTGLYVYKNSKLEKHLTTKDGLVSDQIYALDNYNGKIYISTSKGIQVYDQELDSWSSFSFADGLILRRVNEIIANEHGIYLRSGHNLQKINSHSTKYSKIAPELNALTIYLNGIKTNNNSFDYKERDLSFELSSNSLRNINSLVYEYRLKNIDPEWKKADQINNKVNYKNLAPGNYTFSYRAKSAIGIATKTKNYSFTINKPWYQTYLFYSSLIIFFVGTIGAIYWIRIRSIKRKAAMEKQILSTEIRAIKAQLNPHFIFNALNSVQDLIVQKDIRSSNIYLGKFAELMRGTLDSAEKEFIEVNEEIKMLQIYLELEALRFDKDFHYYIKSELNEEEECNLKIPAMLLQPYVENAIKHGLLHKDGNKIIEIGFKKIGNNQLYCYVKDNGIGRKESEVFKANNPITHQSFANKANEKRITLINHFYKQNMVLNIVDLYEERKSKGTLVAITIDF